MAGEAAGKRRPGDPSPRRPDLLHEVMPSRRLAAPGPERFLDALAVAADGPEGTAEGGLRLFFGGATAASLLPQGLGELRAIAGGLMVATRGHAGDFRLALAGGGHAMLPVTPDRSSRFAGRRVLFLLRVAETAEQVAQSLRWHAARHGAEAALVVNRAPGGDGAAFAAALAAATGGALALTVADLSLPAGAPDSGPETHPFLAPAAPGKDRMERPAPDPWRAPLAEGILFEWMRWRYLARARSVASLEACDILAPPDAATVFELAEAHGVVALAGRHAYPWRLRERAQAGFGDHICRMFDDDRAIMRWACAPGRLDAGQVWRPSRIQGARPRLALPFWRAMTLRVNAGGDLPLAPKTSLIEEAGLLALSAALGARPVRAPQSRPRAAPAATIARQRVAIVTTMKNEGPFILEWLAHHRAIGVSDFLIYTNDCTDGTDSFLQLLAARGLCQWRDNPYRTMGIKPQHAALQAAESEAVMQEADWGVCMDVDEFINVKIGDGRLPALFAAMEAALPGANMIAMTWRLFGNAEVHAFADEPVTARFHRCAPELSRKPHQAWGFKTLFRNIALYKKLGVHRPKGLKPDLWEEVRWLNGSGKRLPRGMFRNAWRSTGTTYGYDWVQLNHYAVRSAESFLVKRDRGRVNHVDRDQGLNYWFRMNHNAAEDRSIQRLQPLMLAERDRLLADPDIRAAHESCVAAHREKIAELHLRPEYAAFYRELTAPRMESLCRMQGHFGAAVFSAGPAVIPADLDLENAGPDFFFTVDYAGDQQH